MNIIPRFSDLYRMQMILPKITKNFYNSINEKLFTELKIYDVTKYVNLKKKNRI